MPSGYLMAMGLLLALLLAAPAAAATASEAHARARAVHEEAVAAMNEADGRLRDLSVLRSRYAADMDAEAVGAERAERRRSVEEAHRRFQLLRRELLELRKDNQGAQLVRLLAQVPKDQFAAGLMESLDFDRFLADLSGFSRRVEEALRDDDAAFAEALLEAGKARTLRLVLLGAGGTALLAVLAFVLWPPRRKAVLLPHKPDVPRLQ